MEKSSTFLVFVGQRRVAVGSLSDILPKLKARFDSDPSEQVLIFDVESGKQVDFDLRGSVEDVLGRYASRAPRGPGRPKLGVAAREVTLLPRHWEWLDEQPSGASAALRRLVEVAARNEPGSERARRMRGALSNFLSAMAGDRPNYEEVCRAVFAGDVERLKALVARWPKDIRQHVVEQAEAAKAAEKAR